MQDMICVITGATSGLGKAIALLMAHRGATLVVPCRNAQKGQQLVHEVQRATQRATVDIVPADLSSQQSIRQFVARFRSRYARLDILVNNAALITPERTTTVDGLETQFAVNHLAPFLLTNLLLDSLASSPAARIINVASNSYKAGWIDFDDWKPDFLEEELSGQKNYLLKSWTDLQIPDDKNHNNDLYKKLLLLITSMMSVLRKLPHLRVIILIE